ncbi:o-succinylbenzoate synthase [Gaoshiqia sediminis]|uniref:o-succinylbenzoate synthase n=1 Tax=Gaoshiqia sediminis TaxID=2986998 RepID=A0AA42C9W4_9BACT|nr:o-succinylbenzoate synthase [Gaoshiqia sediminis]MCW0482675.1 o-succinylbenzoate synthase [Gaoshiqia sediminis]
MIGYFKKYELLFKQPAGTSRGVLNTRTVWYLYVEENGRTGLGECAPLPGLSKETPDQIDYLIEDVCSDPMHFAENQELLLDYPSLRFALETALLDLKNGGHRILFPSPFTEGKAGIPINGLIWMGEAANMQSQTEAKLAAGFRCLKLKIGAIDFETELELLQSIRKRFSPGQITLRVDANGAFKVDEARKKLELLAALQLHSIEQPIAAGRWTDLAKLCEETPVPIALDEELIGLNKREDKELMLDMVRPQYLVLKPSLLGGLSGCDEWIELAEERNIGWWITSYLESNIGLNAIAQWAFTKNIKTHQGLGTGQLFTNNIDSPLEIRGEQLWFDPNLGFGR